MGAIPPIRGEAGYLPAEENLQILAREMNSQLGDLTESVSSLSLERVKSPEYLQGIAEQIKQLYNTSSKAASI